MFVTAFNQMIVAVFFGVGLVMTKPFPNSGTKE
jgi:hypothetical protein